MSEKRTVVAGKIRDQINNASLPKSISKTIVGNNLLAVLSASPESGMEITSTTTISADNELDFFGKILLVHSGRFVYVSTSRPLGFVFSVKAVGVNNTVVLPGGISHTIKAADDMPTKFICLGGDVYAVGKPSSSSGTSTAVVKDETMTGSITLDDTDKDTIYNNYSGLSYTVTLSSGLPVNFVAYLVAGDVGSEIIVNWDDTVISNINNYKPPVILSWDGINKRSSILRIRCTGTLNKFDFLSDSLRFNEAPTCDPVIVGTNYKEGVELTVNVRYLDAENDPEGVHLYEWYRADNSSGSNAVQVATTASYTPVAADVGKFLAVKVTPKASAGATTGTAKTSPYVGAIAAASQTHTLVKTIKIDFNRYGSTAPAEWNKATRSNLSTLGQVIADLLDTTGAVTGISLSLEEALSGGNEDGAQISDGTLFPASVLKNTWRASSGVTGRLKLAGLSGTHVYTYTYIGRAHTDLIANDCTTVIGMNSDTKTYNAVDNTDSPVTFTHIAPSASLDQDFTLGTSGAYGFLSGMIIEVYSVS